MLANKLFKHSGLNASIQKKIKVLYEEHILH